MLSNAVIELEGAPESADPDVVAAAVSAVDAVSEYDAETLAEEEVAVPPEFPHADSKDAPKIPVRTMDNAFFFML